MLHQWTVSTLVGRFMIRCESGHFVLRFEDEILGTYLTPQAALEQLVSGATTYRPSNGVDTSIIGIPADLDFWDS